MIQSMSVDDSVELRAVSCLVYGMPNAGKTRMIRTAPDPYIFDLEHNLSSVKGGGLHYHRIDSLTDFSESRKWWFESNEAKQYKTLCIDSVSKLGEYVLKYFEDTMSIKDKNGVVRQAANKWDVYAAVRDWFVKMLGWIKIHDRHVYMIASIDYSNDPITSKEIYVPHFPGKATLKYCAYTLSELWLLRKELAGENVNAYLLTDGVDSEYIAKDHSGRLGRIEEPNLTNIFEKILRDDKDNNKGVLS